MYAKLFSRITESSIIEESVTTRWVFVALLAIADQDGTVIGTDIAIARRINVDLEDFQESMKVLMSPDKDSNNPEEDGRRVLPSQGERGYFLTGYQKYKSIKTEEERRSYMRQYMHDYRNKNHDPVNNVKPVNNLLTPLTHTDTSTNSNKDKISVEFSDFWKAYPNKKAKPKALAAFNKHGCSKNIAQILRSIEAQKKSPSWMKDAGQYIPHPATWINNERWNDEIDSTTSKPPPMRSSEEYNKILKDKGMI